MANTYVDYTGDGEKKSFAYTFAVLSGQHENHIIVGIDDSTTTGGKFEVVDSADYTIDTSAGTITFDTAPESGARIRIRRDSDASTLLVDFKNGTVLPERDLDLSYLHNLFLNEEIEEGSGKNTLVKNEDGNYDGDSVKLVNLADPENAQDAVTKGYADGRYVDEAGDTMSGPLNMNADIDLNSNNSINNVKNLSLKTDPTSNDHAVRKSWADTTYINVNGDSMTGALTLPGVDPSSDNHAARKKYVDKEINDAITAEQSARATDISNEQTARIAGDALKVNILGDTMTGALTLPGVDPSSDNHATRKRYVDQQIAVAVSSGTPGGPIDTANISDGAITTDKIADDAVTAAKLDHTAVTPGSYTNTDITVDENGRITAASSGSSGAGATNLGNTPTATNVEITSSTGTNTTVAGATTSLAGVMTGTDKQKLNGIETGATADQTASEILTAVKTVDGTGSGLDADLLDGQHASAFAAASHTHTAANITDFDTEVANNSAVVANTAKVSNATHTGDVSGSTALTITDGAVTAAKISSTDTTLNVNDTNNNIGTGALADASYQLTVDGGSSKTPIYAKGNKNAGYVDIDIENESATGNGARLWMKQDGNAAVFQYQESGDNASIVLVDGNLNANAGIKISCASASQGVVSPSGSMYSNPNSNIDLGTANNQWGTVYASAVNINGNTSFVSKYDSGWFNDSGTGLSNGSSYNFSHTLGTAAAQVQVWMAKNSSGLDQTLVGAELAVSGPTNLEWGCQVKNVTSSNITIQLCADGTVEFTSAGHTSYNWGTTFTHIKVIAIG